MQVATSAGWLHMALMVSHVTACSDVLPGGANLHPVKGNGGLQQMVWDAKALTQKEGQLAPISSQLAAQLVDVLPHCCSMPTCNR